MIKERIEQFYKENKIDIKVIKKVEGLQLTTFFGKINCYDVRTINKILKLKEALCLFLQVNKVNVLLDNESGCIVFEIPKKERNYLSFENLQKDYVKDTNGLYVNLGMDTKNNVFNLDLCKTPHLLISGTTGSGKSVLINSILTNLLLNYKPTELELMLVDVKQVEFSIYKDIPHLLFETITNLEDTRIALKQCIKSINARYEILKHSNCRNIQEYNRINQTKMKYRLIVIDELAELLMLENKSKLRADLEGYDRIENQLCRIAQIGRACGVHLIVATQRPSTDVITGLLKSNIPSRIALSVSSAVDSKVILDKTGAENLLGKGDMFLKLIGNEELIRLQSAYISDEEQIKYIESIKNKYKNYTKNDKTYFIEDEKKKIESTEFNKEKIDTIIEQNIRYSIERNTILSYADLKLQIYNYANRNMFINKLRITESEKEYARNNYIKVANKVFAEYDKIYKLKEKPVRKTTKRSKITGLGITYCVGSGIYGFLKGLTKGR